jgi:hypothetical protein
VPYGYTVDFFESREFTLIGSFVESMAPGKTECLAFRKRGD